MLPFLLLFLCSRSTVLFFVAFFVPRVFQSCDDELHVLYSSSDDVVVMPPISNTFFVERKVAFVTVAPDKYFHQHSNLKRFL